MIKCINKSHPEFKALLEQSRKGSFELEMDVYSWQEANGVDRFPSLEEIESMPSVVDEAKVVDDHEQDVDVRLEEAEAVQEVSQESLYEQLKGALAAHGVSIVSLEKYQEMMESKGVVDGVQGVADLLNKIIAVSDASHLPEEAMHFAVAAAEGTKEFEQAMSLVELHPDYAEIYEQYIDVYEGDVVKVKMEALGKIGAKAIFRNEPQRRGLGLLAKLRAVWNRFFDKAQAAKDQLEPILAKIAKSFVAGDLSLEGIEKRGEFYSLARAEKIYDSVLQGMKSKYELEQRRGRPFKSLRDVYYEIRDAEAKVGIIRFLGYMKEDMESVKAAIENFRKNGGFTGKDWKDMYHMLEFYAPSAGNIRWFIEHDLAEDTEISDVEKAQLISDIEQIILDLSAVQSYHNMQTRILARSFAYAEAEKSIPDKELLAKEKEKIDAALNQVDYDSNAFMYYFGSQVGAIDPLARAVHSNVVKTRIATDRFTREQGKELTLLAEDLDMLDSSSLIELDSDGKQTGYFMSRHKRGEWSKAREKFHRDLHEEFGLPEDRLERAEIKYEWRKAARKEWEAKEDKTIKLTEEEIKQAAKIREYSDRLFNWYAANTKPVKNFNDIINERKAQLGGPQSEAYKEWAAENMGRRRDGTVYFMGELSEPSDGTKNAWEGMTKDWKNPAYGSLGENQKKMLAALMEKMKEANKKLPYRRDLYLLPMVRASDIDALKAGKLDLILEDAKETFQTQMHDTEFGDLERSITRQDGSIVQFVPTRFTRMLKKKDKDGNLVDNPEAISRDILSSVILYLDMAENFKNMASMEPTYQLVLEALGQRKVQKGRKQYSGKESESFKALEKFIEMNVLEKWSDRVEWKGMNISKIMAFINRAVAKINLGGNLFVTVNNWLTGSVYSKIEDLVGRYSNQEAKWAAEKVWDTNIHKMVLESGKVNKTSKLGLFFEAHQIMKGNQALFDDLDKSRLTRKAMETGLYWSYEPVKLRVRGKMALAQAHFYRYYQGKFKTINELVAMGVEYKELPTYWDMHEVRDGKLVALHEDKDIADVFTARVQYIGDVVDAQASRSDWAAAHQHFLGQLVTTHRNWLFRNIQLRLKPESVNYITGQAEEGYYVSMSHFLQQTMFNKDRVLRLKEYLNQWEQLSEPQKYGVLHTLYEMAFITAIATVAYILNNLADDDDSWLAQYLAYQSNRILLEVGALNPGPAFAIGTEDVKFRMPFLATAQELTGLLNSPIAATRQIDDIMDLLQIFSGDEVQSGPYKGLTKRERGIYKLIPGVKGYYQARSADGIKSQNAYLKNKVLKWIKD
jgi:hypothetical protein